jgi:aspartate kinase
MPKILKFGGTSVGTAVAIKQLISIIKTSPKGSVAVFSAFAKVTDLIAEATEIALTNLEKAQEFVYRIEMRALGLIEEVISDSELIRQAENQVQTHLNELNELLESINFLKECHGSAIDSALAKGELVSSTVIHYALLDSGIKSYLADSRDFMISDSNYCQANPQYDLITEKIKSELIEPIIVGDYHIAVTQGFIGRSTQLKTTTLGRGGSDFSASIIGACMAKNDYAIDSIDIYTDVNGVMTADPRLVPNAKSIDKISISEMLEMSYFGAKVLHPKTILPALEAQIPVNVMNTMNSAFLGTKIINEKVDSESAIHSIINLKDLYIFRIAADDAKTCTNEVHNLSQRIMATNSTIIYSSIIAYKGLIIAMVPDKTNLMVFQSNGKTPEAIFGCAITGENLSLNDDIMSISKMVELGNTKPKIDFYQSPTGNSIIITCDIALDLQQIHDKLIIRAIAQ